MKTSARRLPFPILTAMILATGLPTARAATKTYFGPDNGVWTTAANWNPAAVPVAGDDVFLGSHTAGTTDLHVTYNETASLLLNSVTLNSTGIGGFMIVNQTSATSRLNVNTLTVGDTVIKNTWNQSAGTVTINTALNIGLNAGSSSGNSYNLSGTGSVSSGAFNTTGFANIGVSGAGVFNQTGGTFSGNNLSVLGLGINTGSSGTYNLSAGLLTAFDFVRVGEAGTGLFTQTGGGHTAYGLEVGAGTGTGTYNMSGGTLDTISTGIVGGGGGSTGTFNLSGGTVTSPNPPVGTGLTVNSGGTFNLQTGGTLKSDVTVNTGGLFALQGGVLGTAPNVTLFGGAFRLLGHNVTLSSLAGTGGIVESAAGNAVLTLNFASSGGDYSGTIQNGASSILSVVVNGPTFQQTLSGTNTYTGSTTLTAGNLAAGSNTGFSSASTFIVNGGLLKASGFDVTIASLSGTGGAVSVGTGSITAGGNNNSGIYSGLLTGSGTLFKTGNGQLTLNGGGTFTGSINVQAGSLRTTAVDGLPTGATVQLTGLGTSLNVNASQTLAALSGASLVGVNFLGGGTLTVGGGNADTAYSGGFTGGGTLTKTGTGIFTLGFGAGDTVSGNADTSLAFNVTGGTLALNKADGTNAIAGPLTVNSGTVLL